MASNMLALVLIPRPQILFYDVSVSFCGLLCFVCPMEVQALTTEMPLVKQFRCPENWSDFGSLVIEAILVYYMKWTLNLLVFMTCSLAAQQREAAVTYYQELVLLDPWLALHHVGRHDTLNLCLA